MPSNPTLDDHGERLRTLEGGMAEIKTDTALCAQRLETIAEKINEGFKAVNDRLDRGADQFDAHEKRLDKHDSRLARADMAEAAKVKRWSLIKKIGVPLIGATAGAIASGGGLWHWIAALFGGG
jgi:aconitase B